ncbi:MAG: nitrate reductase molybdenum cofactor assembly chaperone [Nocardioides sp.]
MRRWLSAERLGAAGRHTLDAAERQAAWAASAALLEYPSDEVLAALPQVRTLVEELPELVAEPLLRVVGTLEAAEPEALRTEYVERFDHARRRSLFLTYFVHGDTRRRGLALLRFKQAYAAAGLSFGDDELPDHLCVVLQFGALHDHDAAWKLLLDHRAGVELLRLAARETSWGGVLEAVSASLPPLRGEESEAVARLMAEGPPAEEVGLQPYLIDPQIPVGPPPGSHLIGANR